MTARDDIADALLAERYSYPHWWATPDPHWNAAASTAALTFNDDDVTRARRRREALAEWEAAHDEEGTG